MNLPLPMATLVREDENVGMAWIDEPLSVSIRKPPTIKQQRTVELKERTSQTGEAKQEGQIHEQETVDFPNGLKQSSQELEEDHFPKNKASVTAMEQQSEVMPQVIVGTGRDSDKVAAILAGQKVKRKDPNYATMKGILSDWSEEKGGSSNVGQVEEEQAKEKKLARETDETKGGGGELSGLKTARTVTSGTNFEDSSPEETKNISEKQRSAKLLPK